MNAETSARNSAIAYHNQGLAGVKQDPQLAYRLLCSAVTVDPTFAQGWYSLGNACADLKLLPAACAAFRRALECPKGELPGDLTKDLQVKCHTNLGHFLYHSGEIESAYLHTQLALLEDDKAAFAWTNLSMIYSLREQHDAAINAAMKGWKLDPTPMAETALAFAYLFAGEFAAGLQRFEARIAYKLGQLDSYPYPRWDGKPHQDKTILVLGEQGLGDSLSFARFLPEMCDLFGKVILSVQAPLVPLLKVMLPASIEIIPTTTNLPLADFWTPLGSLPVGIGMTTEEFINRGNLPIRGIPKDDASWKTPDKRLHIGIAWAGNKDNEIDRWRSVDIRMFLELYRVPGVQLYSLQVGERSIDLHNAGCAGLIRDLSPYIHNALDTASIMQELDLIVTIESFMGHLAGALGSNCFLLSSYVGGDYRVGRAGNSPLWYSNTTVFRQSVEQDWKPVMDRIVKAVDRMI